MRKIILAASAFTLIGAYAGRNLLRNAKGISPSAFGMEQIDSRVFADAAMDDTTRKNFLASIHSARELAKAAFGNLSSAPTIIGCSTEACFNGFGEKFPRATTYHHWWLLVSPRGLNTHIIAHELAHAELHKRIGFYRTFISYPRWLDEGMAVWVSKDPRYTDSSGMKPGFEFQVEEKDFEKEWRRHMDENTGLAYPFACWAFLDWRKRNPEFSALWK